MEALKKELGKGDKVNGDKVKELLGKLGEATTATADEAPGRRAAEAARPRRGPVPFRRGLICC